MSLVTPPSFDGLSRLGHKVINSLSAYKFLLRGEDFYFFVRCAREKKRVQRAEIAKNAGKENNNFKFSKKEAGKPATA
ncbi:MAG: hypothetical protein PUK79_07555 [Clostridiales bacterium]|nr:hypothetical protein [Clostridiales bacterium]MDY2834954.1 hypothetical protein [Candidatus Aphodomonas sp.]